MRFDELDSAQLDRVATGIAEFLSPGSADANWNVGNHLASEFLPFAENAVDLIAEAIDATLEHLEADEQIQDFRVGLAEAGVWSGRLDGFPSLLVATKLLESDAIEDWWQESRNSCDYV